MLWLVAAFMSALFAGVTSIFAKCGIKKTDSDLVTAMRTIVVFIFSLIMVFVANSFMTIKDIELKTWFFLILSGISTGISWICYYKALSLGDVNKVIPIDKSSTIITILLAIIFFHETANIVTKLVATILLSIGIFLMIEKKEVELNKPENKKWIIYAFLSAIFASLTSIFAKIGIDNVESNLGTSIRTMVVLLISWGIVLAKGKQKDIKNIEKKDWLFITLSGISTGISWLCYYYALQKGVVSVVVSIDKLSIVVTILLSYFILKEKLSLKSVIGLILMVVGILLMVFF